MATENFNISSRVAQALENTPSDYLTRTLKSRTSEPAGSFVQNVSAEELRAMITNANWVPVEQDPALPFSFGLISAPAKRFITRDIQGVLGMVALDDLSDDTPLVLSDPKSTGYFSTHVDIADVGEDKYRAVGFSVLMLGPGDGEKEIMWTFHPGSPAQPQGIPSLGKANLQVTVKELRDLYPGQLQDMMVKMVPQNILDKIRVVPQADQAPKNNAA